MELLLTCRYCNNTWRLNPETLKANGYPECSKCGDENIDIKELDKSRIDSYIGCPKFPEPKEESGNTDFPFWSGD